MSANPLHSTWRNKMPKKLRKRFENLLPKIKTTTTKYFNLPPPKQLANSTKWMIFKRCQRTETLSFAVPETQSHHRQSNSNDAATLADVDRFLLENFRSLFHNEEENCNSQELSFESPRLDDIRSTQRFFASPCKSSSLIEDARLSTSFCSDLGCSTSTDTVVSTDSGSVRVSSEQEGIAVLTFSTDPYDDFRESMVEMIEARLREHKRLEWDFMEDLLFCYLNMNDKKSFKYILCAFSDLVVSLRRGAGELPAGACKNPGSRERR